MVNLNIKIPDELHKEIKLRAVMEDISLKDYVIKLLEENIK
jgi:predicted HicB family RNase H-like nuclease